MSETEARLTSTQVDFLVDAGADTQVRNRNGDLAIDLVDKEDEDLRAILMKADLGMSIQQRSIAIQSTALTQATATTMADDVVDLDDVVDDDDIAGDESD